MSERPATRILLLPPGRPAGRTAIDWIGERLRHARVIVPASARAAGGLPGRLDHEPFAAPDPSASARAESLAALLSAPRQGASAPAAWAIEAAALALLEGGAVLAADAGLFRDLIPISSWSMNVRERPTDGLLVQHLGIAGRMPAALRPAAGPALAALASGDEALLQRTARARRRAARDDGPARFARVAKTSAGLRPFLVYLDLFPPLAAGGAPCATWVAAQDRSVAEALLSTAAAVFI